MDREALSLISYAASSNLNLGPVTSVPNEPSGGIRENGACGSPQGLFSQPFTVSLPCVHRCVGDGPYTGERRTTLRPFIVRLSPAQTTPNAANSDTRGDTRKRPEMHRNTHPVRARSDDGERRERRHTQCRAEATRNAGSPRAVAAGLNESSLSGSRSALRLSGEAHNSSDRRRQPERH